MTTDTTALLEELRGLLGPAQVLTSNDATSGYRRERRGLFTSAPLAVVRPADTAEVAAVVRACAAAGAGVIPQGGNTGLVGGSSAVGERPLVVLSTERLDRVRRIEPANFTLTVEAGCTLGQVQRAAAGVDRLFPLSYAAEEECRIGGNLATNAGGMNVLRYGNARDLTLGLEVVLADGRIWNGLTALRKDNSGYDLRDLFIGAEGTLGIITAAVFRCFPRPRHLLTGCVALDRPEDAVALLGDLQATSGEALSAFEFLSRMAVTTAVRHDTDSHDPFDREYAWYVIFDIATSREHDDLRGLIAPALDAARAASTLRDYRLADDARGRGAIWRIRSAIPTAQSGEGASIKHDISVPVSRVPEFLERADAAVTAHLPGTRPCAFGHLGDGNVHYNLTQPQGMSSEAFLAKWDEFSTLVHDIVADMGGSFAAEHGVGRLKPGELARLKSPVEIELIQAVKHAFDPADVLNPGVLAPGAYAPH